MSPKAYWRELREDGLKLVRRDWPTGEGVVALIQAIGQGRYRASIPVAGILLFDSWDSSSTRLTFPTLSGAKAWVEAEMGPRLVAAGCEVNFDKVRPLPGKSKATKGEVK